MLGIAWLIDEVVTCNPRVGTIAGGDFDPQPDAPVLMVFVLPESGIAAGVVTVPVGVLPAGQAVHV